MFEQSAVLTEAQQAALDVIAATCTQRPLPRQLLEEGSLGGAGGAGTPLSIASAAPPTPLSPSVEATASSFAGTSFEDVVLQNSSDFYRWLGELEAARSSETEEKFRRYGDALQAHLDTCDGLLAKVAGASFHSLCFFRKRLGERLVVAPPDPERLAGLQPLHVVALHVLL